MWCTDPLLGFCQTRSLGGGELLAKEVTLTAPSLAFRLITRPRTEAYKCEMLQFHNVFFAKRSLCLWARAFAYRGLSTTTSLTLQM